MIVHRIFLSWRRGEGANRFLVGEIVRHSDNRFTFNYRKAEVEKAKQQGFAFYPEFPDTEEEYGGDLQSVFSLRLMPEGRADRNVYLDFWEANNPAYDWFDELALTQGKLATDNFEFLGEYNYDQNGFRFVTDIAALTYINVHPDIIKPNDKLDFLLESTNINDPHAVKVLKENVLIGYIKRGHNSYFKDANPNRIQLSVKAIEKNGRVNEIYLSVVKK